MCFSIVDLQRVSRPVGHSVPLCILIDKALSHKILSLCPVTKSFYLLLFFIELSMDPLSCRCLILDSCRKEQSVGRGRFVITNNVLP